MTDRLENADGISPTTQKQFDFLSEYADEFARTVGLRLFRLSDAEVVEFYLLTHTDFHLGHPATPAMKCLMDLAEVEFDRRERQSHRAAKNDEESGGGSFGDWLGIVKDADRSRLRRELLP